MSGNSGCPFFLWGLLAFLGLALVISLIFNISHYIEKQRQDKMYRYSDDYIPRIDEYYTEDTPIYGNLDNIIPAMDENCYEQMKARPDRSVNDMQEAAPSAHVPAEAQMCYASLDHSFKGKRRKPKKQNAHLSEEKDKQLHAMDASISKNNLVESVSPESQEIEENIHDDPIRLFGLIRAKREPINQADYDLSQ
ncbi:T-cell receptor-associated transmembrane adapter 1 isoform X2 [Sciurus carolinensis]|uniref:T-cell receptor-associated transmembrane adapter 1 isoform X2 n=1 Tax=Sciurus carolinensis TaxID=30640 RepID=UPI001FB1A332|nr:T-cell receptor-associated transmembrane adapter 1 isoform X2 [Sciurus carolinensis]